MGSVDLVKSLLTNVNDRFIPQRVVFHHVPKCGGTSVGRALRKRFLTSQATVIPESSFKALRSFTGRTDRDQLLVDVLDLREQMFLYLLHEDIRCISLHVRFSEIAFQEFRDRYRFITILRDPVERFVSHYHWDHGKPGTHAHISESLEAFLDTPRARRLGATYVEYFAGLPKEADLTTPTAIAAAIANLGRMDVVGRLDDLPGFQAKLRDALGVRLRFGHENKARGPRSVARTPPELAERLRALCAPDIAVWEALYGSAAAPA